MNRLQGKRALITGATSGIGLETARLFAQSGCHLLLNARRADRLNETVAELKAASPSLDVDFFVADVADSRAVEGFLDAYPPAIDILVNNAGLALGTDPIHAGDPEDWDRMIDTNIRGLLTLTRSVSRGMVERGSGHIINLGSLAGHETYGGGTVYCATKHAVRAITLATKKDLHGTGVRVSAVSPGLVDTEFSTVRFKGDKERADRVYEGMTPLTGRDIAELIHFIANRPPHVDVLDLLVTPVDQSASTQVHRRSLS